MSENIKYIQSYIKNVLYPEKVYSRITYNDLDELLITYFLSVVKISEKKQKIFQSGKIGKIQALTDSILSFDHILKDNPHLIVLLHKGYIERYIRRKLWNKTLHDDLIQEVFTRLLQSKIYRIYEHYKKNYKNNSNFLSYFSVSLRNTYIEALRSKNIVALMNDDVELTEKHVIVQENLFGQSMIETEIYRFEKVLKLYHNTKPKLILCLKLKYGIEIIINELNKSFPQYSTEDLKILTGNYDNTSINDIFDEGIHVFNKYDRKMKNGDSLRKWINRIENELMEKMNIFHLKPIYNNNSFSKLVQVYFMKSDTQYIKIKTFPN